MTDRLSIDERSLPAEGPEALRRAVLPHDVLRALRTSFGLRQVTVAAACGTSDRAVRKWEQGGSMRRRSVERLTALADIVLVLSTTLIGAGFDQWLWARLRTLDSARPVELLAQDRPEPVLAAARAFAGGDIV